MLGENTKNKSNYDVKTAKDSQIILNCNISKPDRRYMSDQMGNHFTFFNDKKVNNLQNFIQPLKNCCFKSKDLKKLIVEFLNTMKITKSINIVLLKDREFKKANTGETNILYNRLALEYPTDFLSFSRDYINKYFSQNPNSKRAIMEFNLSVNNLIKQTSNDQIIFSHDNFPEHFDGNDFFSYVESQENNSNDLLFDDLLFNMKL